MRLTHLVLLALAVRASAQDDDDDVYTTDDGEHDPEAVPARPDPEVYHHFQHDGPYLVDTDEVQYDFHSERIIITDTNKLTIYRTLHNDGHDERHEHGHAIPACGVVDNWWLSLNTHKNPTGTPTPYVQVQARHHGYMERHAAKCEYTLMAGFEGHDLKKELHKKYARPPGHHAEVVFSLKKPQDASHYIWKSEYKEKDDL